MPETNIPSRKFFEKPTLQVAEALLGSFLVRRDGKKTIRARITEVEAYIGEDDLACHAKVGRTKRTETLYGKAGHAYVYLIYGMYHCLNIVTEAKDYPAAVLIRAVQVEGVPHRETNGPGKLCRFLAIDKKNFNGHDLLTGKKLWVERPSLKLRSAEKIEKSKRVNIGYARHCTDYLWRFELVKEIHPVRSENTKKPEEKIKTKKHPPLGVT